MRLAACRWTGGLGFIGSAFIRALAADGVAVLNVVAQAPYAGDERRLAAVTPGLVQTVHMDVAAPEPREAVQRERPVRIVHFAAETQATRSEGAAEAFDANVEGTRGVLDAAVAAGVQRVVHVSTDEVYGPCPARRSARGRSCPARAGDQPVRPLQGACRRPRALVRRPPGRRCRAADQLHRAVAASREGGAALGHPRAARRGAAGVGRRQAGARLDVRRRRRLGAAGAASGGSAGTAYNLGPAAEGVPNVEIARMVARAAGGDAGAVYLSEYDRPQHDRRDAVSVDRIAELGWTAAHTLERTGAATVAWYRDHAEWWRTLVPEAERLYAD